tara:strand:+ start:1380 stop:2237 length:858 start_codon:yes stop_codon:yes gene_type:complete
VIERENRPSLFRENALKHLNAAQSIETSLQVVEVNFIVYLVASLLVLFSLIIWCVFGKITVEVPARGMLLPAQRISLAEQFYQANKKDHEMSSKAMKDLLDKKLMLYKKRYITRDEVERARQDYLHARDTSLSTTYLSNAGADDPFNSNHVALNEELMALVFVSHAEGKRIARGMEVFILPSTLSPYEYGYIKGKVISVSGYPASKEVIFSYLGNMSLVEDIFSQDVPFLVKVSLQADSAATSGLRWSSKQGAPFKVESGSAVTVKIISHHYHPYQLLFNQNEKG